MVGLALLVRTTRSTALPDPSSSTPIKSNSLTLKHFMHRRYLEHGIDIDAKFGGSTAVENLRKWVRSQKTQELERVEGERQRVPGSPPGRPLSEVRTTPPAHPHTREKEHFRVRFVTPTPADSSKAIARASVREGRFGIGLAYSSESVEKLK